jgi:hypothetical protein
VSLPCLSVPHLSRKEGSEGQARAFRARFATRGMGGLMAFDKAALGRDFDRSGKPKGA